MSTNEAETNESVGENRSEEKTDDIDAQEDEGGIEEGNPRLFSYNVDTLLNGMPTFQ